MTERDKIVAWLRGQGPPRSDAAYWAAIFADSIEAGEHLRRPEPTIPASEWRDPLRLLGR